jgi:adenylate kinase family enzyme
VPLLTAYDHVEVDPRRILVAGPSGSGKTTLAQRISSRTGIAHTELDALFHGPGWTPRAEFVADVRALAARSEWITEWQYGAVRPLLAARAELLVWLDLAKPAVMHQVIARSVRRSLTREVLWNGNVEPPLRSVLYDPEHVVRWAWSTHGTNRARVLALGREHPTLPIVRLGSRQQVEHWIARLAG